jgi:glycosyltransferase involved in cell wall biosynthesis
MKITTVAPQVSVLMSCYNAERWVVESIESVLNQTFREFELLLIDDGSKDGTWEIIERYRALDSRVVGVKKKNTGLADSLNKGIALAKGKWIARLDADDLCEPSRLAQQVEFVSHNPDVVLLGSAFVEIDENGRPCQTHVYPFDNVKLVSDLERSRRFFPHSSAMYRTDLVRDIGGYNGRIHRAEDVRLWLELAVRGRIACLPAPLLRIRKHPNQISNDANGLRQFYDGRAARVCHFLRKMGYDDPSLGSTDEEWRAFLGWVERKIDESKQFQRRKVVAEARQIYRREGARFMRAARCILHLATSGHFFGVAFEKWFGTSLPRQLAREWTETRPDLPKHSAPS